MTLSSLAEKINRSVGYISQVERNKSEVTIACLNEISNALQVDLSWFFDTQAATENKESEYIVRATHRRKLNFTGVGMHEELLSPQLSGESLMILNISKPGSSSGGLIKRDVEMSGYIVSGRLKLIFEHETYALNTGDSFVLPRNKAHDFENVGTSKCEVLWYITPAIY